MTIESGLCTAFHNGIIINPNIAQIPRNLMVFFTPIIKDDKSTPKTVVLSNYPSRRNSTRKISFS